MSVKEKLSKPVEKLATTNRWVRGIVILAVAAGVFFGLDSLDPDPEVMSKLVGSALTALAALATILLKKIDLSKIDLPGEWDDELRKSLPEDLKAMVDKEKRARADTSGAEGVPLDAGDAQPPVEG